MADNEKKYAGLATLQTFLDNLKNLFATKTSVDELSADVAYINEEDNENITDVETGGTTNVTVDSALSETSTNPVQNKVITEKINEVETAIADLPQADWNQNDSTAKDYVKNRPFWTDDPKEMTLIEEQTVTIGSDLYTQLDGSHALEVGKTYTVIFNGTTYSCVAYSTTELEGFENAVFLGNLEHLGGTGGNGEPFAIDGYEEGEVYLDVSAEGTYTVEIKCVAAEVHKIDEKYLPDTVIVKDMYSDYNFVPIDLVKVWNSKGFYFPIFHNSNYTEEIPITLDNFNYLLNLCQANSNSEIVLYYEGWRCNGTLTNHEVNLYLEYYDISDEGVHFVCKTTVISYDEESGNATATYTHSNNTILFS